MMEPKQSSIYSIISKSIIKSVVKGLSVNNEYLENKSKHLCYCNNSSYKENIINSIYNCIEKDITINDNNHLKDILNNLKVHSVYVYNIGEFWRLYNSLYRFTHSKSFFVTCMPTIITTLATLITLVLSNKLLYAAEMVESIETYLFSSQKNPAQELADLLEMKYGLINLVQYKIFPIIMGIKEPFIGTLSTPIFFAGSTSTTDYSVEVNKIMELPIKTDIIPNLYKFLSEKGINTSNNFAEYIAGLKINEIVKNTCLQNDEDNNLKQVLKNNNENYSGKIIDLLKEAEKHSKGHVLDGVVSSPITENAFISNQIPLSVTDMEKFTILEYLYIMRVMANNIKKKNGDNKTSGGIILNINSPFKTITVPGLNSVK
ncbi:virion structural protein [Sheeppox virus]|uniref:Assembly protein G7 n=1 Tax=Sheeppox virus TaxID=10266 RepID=A0A5C0PUA4_SHEV|nr:virion structural protein [Sheeppox virus]